MMDPEYELQLKKACDRCTKLKAKCSGGNPCERCGQADGDCIYSPRKNRYGVTKKKRRLSLTEIPKIRNFDFSNQVFFNSEFEQRSWSVFLPLFKDNISSMFFWYSSQLKNIDNFFRDRTGGSSFRDWMASLNIDVSGVLGSLRNHVKRNLGEMKQRKIPTIDSPRTTELLNHSVAQNGSRHPCIKVKTMSHSSNDLPVEVLVECNRQFENVFGLTAQEISFDLNNSGGGFLPWCGDVFARILSKDADLKAFIEILTIKFRAEGRPATIPNVRNIASVHKFLFNANGTQKRGALKCAHIQESGESGTIMTLLAEVVFEDSPDTPLGSLMDIATTGFPVMSAQPVMGYDYHMIPEKEPIYVETENTWIEGLLNLDDGALFA